MEAAEASSRSAEREITFAAFLFANFFFAPSSRKEKVAMEFYTPLQTICLEATKMRGGVICIYTDDSPSFYFQERFFDESLNLFTDSTECRLN